MTASPHDDGPAESTQITLSALEGEPLIHEAICDMVVATAHAIAERQGIAVLDISTTPTSLTATLATGRIEAIGFAAELRRLTTTWYCHKFGVASLWGEAETHDSDDETWKQT